MPRLILRSGAAMRYWKTLLTLDRLTWPCTPHHLLIRLVTRIHTYIHTNIHTFFVQESYLRNTYIHTCTYHWIYVRMYEIQPYVRTYIYIHTYITYIHTYIHTYIRFQVLARWISRKGSSAIWTVTLTQATQIVGSWSWTCCCIGRKENWSRSKNGCSSNQSLLLVYCTYSIHTSPIYTYIYCYHIFINLYTYINERMNVNVLNIVINNII